MQVKDIESGLISDESTVEKLSDQLDRREVTSSKLTEDCLAKISASNSKLRLFITVTDGIARSSATRSDERGAASKRKSKLDGIPFAIKDIFFLKGIRCTAGSKILSDYVPDYTATAVEKLEESGAVIVGTTNLHEFASGVTNVNPYYGAARNPWDEERITGGSSGGSAAAVALGWAFAALGTDTSGSVRIPASLCGVVGIKPTFGLVSSRGSIPLSSSFDHVGVLSKSCADAAIVLDAVAGFDSEDPYSVRAPRKYNYLEETLRARDKTFKVGVLRRYFLDSLGEDVRDAFEMAVSDFGSKLGYELRDAEIPGVEQSSSDIWAPIRFAEAAAYHGPWFEKRPDDYGDDVRAKLERGRQYSAIQYVSAKKKALEFRVQMAKVLDDYDALLSPTTPVGAPQIGEASVSIGSNTIDVYTALVRQTQPFNVTGFPAVSVPMGFSRETRMPLGLQIIGKPFHEPTVLGLGSAYETRVGPGNKFPPL